MEQQKLRAMEQFKKSSRGKNRRLKKPEMKPRLKQVSKKQQEFINKQNAQKTPPDPKIAAAALKGSIGSILFRLILQCLCFPCCSFSRSSKFGANFAVGGVHRA